jgi:hypothetical protein
MKGIVASDPGIVKKGGATSYGELLLGRLPQPFHPKRLEILQVGHYLISGISLLIRLRSTE